MGDFLDRKKNSVENIEITREFDCLRTIILNILDTCNMKCPMCPHSIGFNTHNIMKKDVIEELIKQLTYYRYNGIISISGFGEPTLHPQLIDFIQLFKENDLKVELISNGSIECDWEKLSSLCFKIKISNHIENKDLINNIPLLDNIQIRNHYIGSETFYPTNRGGYMNKDLVENDCYYPFYSTFIDYDGHYLICGDDWLRTSKTDKSIFNCDINEYFTTLDKSMFIDRKKSCFECCHNCNTGGIRIGGNFKEWWLNNGNI